MPLKHSGPRILITTEGIEFLMMDGPREVLCRAACDLLREKFGSSGADGDVRVFLLHRDSIERAASDKYEAGEVESGVPWKIIVTASDMASPLSRKV
jgi:hypothetical protein